ncbi:MAG: metallophosphoesterase [Clostridia bacterium]|nr:metallophosphoesterase [Clostridia bacterium]
MNATIRRTEFAPGSRVIVVSDIHGHADWLCRLLAKTGYRPGEDYLIIVGDLIEKGRDSLGVVREAMRLAAESHRVTVMMGNNDLWRLEQLREPTLKRDEILFGSTAYFANRWGGSLFYEMCREAGVTYTSLADLPAAREQIARRFAAELDFLAGLPTVLAAPQYTFVHGGLPCPEDELDTLTTRNAYDCLKYDDFRGDLAARQAPRFSRPVIVGHWPVALYRRTIPEHNPLVDDRFNVISIDGGCGLKRDGQLNALILTPDDGGLAWDSVDDLPTVRALDAQAASADSISINWGDNEVRRLDDSAEARPGYALIEHIRTARRLWIPDDDFYTDDEGRLYCREMTDYALPVQPGDTLSLVKAMPDAAIVKKNGVVGWYRRRWE